MDNGEEVRVTNEQTGGAKGSKLARYDLIPVEALNEVAKLYGAGAAKYEDRNWERGYAWSLSYAALQRHVNAFWGGESIDPETGRHHLAAAVFHCFALMTFEKFHPFSLDDRSATTLKLPPDLPTKCGCGATLPCACGCVVCAAK